MKILIENSRQSWRDRVGRFCVVAAISLAGAFVLTIGNTGSVNALALSPANATCDSDEKFTQADDIQNYLETTAACGPAVFVDDLFEAYKDESEGESGDFAGHYSTNINWGGDPEGGTISFDGTNSLGDFTDIWLVVSDGAAQDPSNYYFNLVALGWDGEEALVLSGFWPDQGAISHVSILVAPVPAALPLLGTALLGIGFLGRRRRKKALAAA